MISVVMLAAFPDSESRVKLGTPGARVLCDRRETVRGCVAPVTRRAIGELYEQSILKSAQLRAHADRLVVGVGDDDHDTRLDRAAVGKSVEDLSR